MGNTVGTSAIEGTVSTLSALVVDKMVAKCNHNTPTPPQLRKMLAGEDIVNTLSNKRQM